VTGEGIRPPPGAARPIGLHGEPLDRRPAVSAGSRQTWPV